MEVLQNDNGEKGRFYILENQQQLAEMTYSWAGKDRFIIDHTEVSDQLRGKGAGYQMVLAAVEYARTHQVAIIPLCPFAKSVFEKFAELRDVL